MNSSGNSEAIRLAQDSDWKGLQRLLERDPVMAKLSGDHDMLPIHWVCTVRRVPLSLIAKLLQAYPDGVRTKNAGDLLPLHIAIRARVQASCLRKLVRAYPEAVDERTPDGLSALEMAEEMGLDAGSLKVLHRAQGRRSTAQQQHDEDSSFDRESVEFTSKRLVSGQEEGEASGVERPEEDEEKKETKEWTDAAVPEPYVGNVGFGGFLHVGDDGELNTTEMSALGPEDSISMMSEQSLSDADGLDSPHDHLVSPSSTSTCSQNDPRSPTSSRSSFGRIRTGSRRGFGGFQNLNPETSRQHSRMQRTASLIIQLQNTGILSERELRTMVSAMSASAAVGNTEDEEELRRSHSRHMSLPLMPSYENLRQKSNFQYYDEDDENEIDNGSSRDSTSTAGGATGNLMNPRGRLFQSAQEPFRSRHSVTPGGSQRGSPPLFRRRHRRASHGSHSRGHFDPPPEWKHDGECSICRASFGMFKHRHHCRNCGKSICSQHSADKKISMEAKGFTTPQRVCVTCYAMITHSRTLQHDLELEDMGRDGSMLNPVAFQQQHYGLSASANDRHASAIASFPSATTPGPSRPAAFGSTRSPATSAGGSPTISPTTGRRLAPRKSSVLAAGEATGGAGERATTSNHASGLSGAPSSPVHELRGLLASQQKQIEQLAQSNMQMQQQLLEQEELKAETMLLITQLMTRVSVLELQKDRTVNSKRRSIGTGDSEDEEFPQDDTTSFER
ncbi:Vacuolar protein sorting-associated protein 27 [Phytophthora citrophthora]|uniref:Vacuolar protein sorting-associated protein 27 n=1 Tax=Phytophthora citrophthora TaxID=4793 RepID=A0AAD9LDC7_9STRA|nr:Vacuolar protein sorting-associated protein 27 [Phytophthora citrophthora]